MTIIASGESNLATGRVAAAHGRFNDISQVAPVCTTPNTRFLRPTRVQIPNGISIGSAVFAHSSQQRVAIFHNAPHLFPENYHSHGRIWIPI